MKISYLVPATALMVVLLVMLNYGASKEAPASRLSGGIDFAHFSGLNPTDLDSELEKISTDRKALQVKLISQIRDPSSQQAKLAAIYLAGYYRMEECVVVLNKIITLRDDRMLESRHLPLWSQWPAVEALTRIGNPAVPEVVHNLATSDSPEIQRLSVLVLKAVLGRNLAKEAVREAIAGQTDSNKEKNVERLNLAITAIDAEASTQR